MAELDYSTGKSITLPTELSSDIIQKTQETSAIMQLATQTDLPGNGLTIPVITGDPEANWSGETDKRKVSTGTLGTKILRPYSLSTIVPFSNKLKRDASALYNEIVKRIPGALAKKFDLTVMGGVDAPGSDFDTFKDITKRPLTTDTAYDQLVEADADIAEHDGLTSGFAISPRAKTVFLKSKDKEGRSLFVNGVADGAIPVLLGSPVMMSKGIYVKGDTTSVVGVVGDWTQARYGTVEGVKITLADQATLTDGDNQINLFQQSMFAVKAEIELGFRADTTVFNALTVEVPKA